MLGLRFRIVLLVLLAVIPALALLLNSGLERRNNDAEQALENQLQLARLLATDLEGQIAETEKLLVPVGTLFQQVETDIQSVRGERCDSFLKNMLSASPSYNNLAVAAPSGEVVCSAHPPTEPLNIGEQTHFRKAVATKQFAMGEFTAQGAAGGRSVDFALPVLSAGKQVTAVVIASLDLQAIDRNAEELELPPGSIVPVTDPNGIILSHTPNPDLWAGKVNPNVLFDPETTTDIEGKVAAVSLDGTPSLLAYTAVREPDGKILARVTLGIPEATAYAPANAALRRDLLLLTLAGAVALLAAWWLGGPFLVDPIHSLTQVARRLARGDFTARTGPGYPRSEVGELGRAFDEMASDLALRREENSNLNRDLERRFEERTAALAAANEQLAKTNDGLKRALEEGQRLERSLQQRTVALEAANKELESFAYSVSHDLRAPLRAIDGFSQTLLRDYSEKLDERGRNRLERVRGAAQRLGQLIDDLLVLSRTSRAEIRPQPLDLAEIARSIARELADGDGARDVQFRVSDELNAHADPGLARVLLQNLLQNAWKFTSHHQRALIEVGAQELDGERVFFVRDDGAGFDMQFVGKLFGAFQRLHSENEFSGDGIGLATAQRIVRRHSGRIWAEGALEGGATVYFTLPDSTNRQEEAAA